MQDTIINFYSTSDDYGDFSNFAAWPIKVDGKTWPTSEHYFQAQKFLDEKYREEIRRVSSPMVAARMGVIVPSHFVKTGSRLKNR